MAGEAPELRRRQDVRFECEGFTGRVPEGANIITVTSKILTNPLRLTEREAFCLGAVLHASINELREQAARRPKPSP